MAAGGEPHAGARSAGAWSGTSCRRRSRRTEKASSRTPRKLLVVFHGVASSSSSSPLVPPPSPQVDPDALRFLRGDGGAHETDAAGALRSAVPGPSAGSAAPSAAGSPAGPPRRRMGSSTAAPGRTAGRSGNGPGTGRTKTSDGSRESLTPAARSWTSGGIPGDTAVVRTALAVLVLEEARSMSQQPRAGLPPLSLGGCRPL